MVQIKAVKNANAVADIRKVEALSKELKSLLNSLGDLKALSEPTRIALGTAGYRVDTYKLGQVVERALDELDAVPATRVDTDSLKLSHGATRCFGLWAEAKADGEGPYVGGRSTGDDYDLINRFMKSHKGLEIFTHHVPFGGAGELFQITGTKAAREKFENDPRLPKLEKALGDIYWTDHAPGYSDEIAKRKRKIKDPTSYVFGK